TSPPYPYTTLFRSMAVYNDHATDPYATGGGGAETRQRVTVTVDPRAVRAGTRGRSLSLHTLDRSTGRPVPVQLAKRGDLLEFTSTSTAGPASSSSGAEAPPGGGPGHVLRPAAASPRSACRPAPPPPAAPPPGPSVGRPVHRPVD